MKRTFNSGVAPGTAANRRKQAETFVKFALCYNVEFLAPSVVDLLMYSQFLANSFASTASVRNYLSGAKVWIVLHNGCISAFETFQLKQMISGVASTSTHVPKSAPPLVASDVKLICDFIDSRNDVHVAVKPCILFAFSCFLRASNVVAPSLLSWGGPHTLRADDVLCSNNNLILVIRSTKTRKKSNPLCLKILPVSNRNYCPVASWHVYKHIVNPCPQGPAFICNDGTPLTARPVVATIKAALKAAGSLKADSISMHSLRRGGTHEAANLGAPHQQIMEHGSWKSKKGLNFYMPKKPSSIPTIIAQSLA